MAWVWKVEAPPKVQFFLWLCLHNSVPTGDVLGSRGTLTPYVVCVKETMKQLSTC